ncbi:hypothetical protein HN51_067851 [Arachis hypogaea]
MDSKVLDQRVLELCKVFKIVITSGEVYVLANEIVKLIPLDRGQHVQLKEDEKEPKYDFV